MKYVIINADDFGFNGHVNRGIIRAHREGVLTSTTLMANMPGFDDAVEHIKKNPRLGVGIHLNLIRGKSVLPKQVIPTLVNKEGNFYRSPARLFASLCLGTVSLKDVRRELEAQIDKVIVAGICPSHVDSEKHSHMIPSILNVVADLVCEKGIGCVRLIDNGAMLFKDASANLANPQLYKSLFLDCFSRSARRRLDSRRLLHADRFYGLIETGNMIPKVYRMIFERIQDGVSEIMTHPGYLPDGDSPAGIGEKQSFISNCREKELKALIDPAVKEMIERFRLKLVNYHDLKKMRPT